MLGRRGALLVVLAASAGAQAAETFRVRVLEQKHPAAARIEVHTGVLSCDGAATQAWLSRVKVTGARVELSDGTLCQKVTAPDASVRLDTREERRYRGELEISVKGAELFLLNTVAMEDYVLAVVPAEQGKAPPAALQAQAVVSRTFALASRGRHAKDNHDFCDLAHCQVYLGRGAETAAASEAIAATQGEVLHTGGKLLPAFFHANCGGATSAGEDVFGAASTGAGVKETLEKGAPVCGRSPDFRWKWPVPRAALAKALGLKPVGRAFEALRRDAAGRVLELKVFGTPMAGPDFEAKVAKAFGYLKLRSLKMNPIETPTTVTFTGFGLGHGVGLCQQGAQALGARGMDYRKILSHYFPDAELGAADP